MWGDAAAFFQILSQNIYDVEMGFMIRMQVFGLGSGFVELIRGARSAAADGSSRGDILMFYSRSAWSL